MPDSSEIIRVLAFDFGLKNIGVAMGQSITATASPLTSLTARNGKPDWSTIAALIAEWRVNQLIVGLPLNMDDTESDMSTAARRFGAELGRRFSIDVQMVDERLTSRATAQQTKGNHAASHALAAVLIAESYLREITRK